MSCSCYTYQTCNKIFLGHARKRKKVPLELIWYMYYNLFIFVAEEGYSHYVQRQILAECFQLVQYILINFNNYKETESLLSFMYEFSAE
jgi:hypothetical protein